MIQTAQEKISGHIVGNVENSKNIRTKGFLILYANCCTNCHHSFNPYGILSTLGLKQLTGRKALLDKGGKFLKKLWCCVGGSITR